MREQQLLNALKSPEQFKELIKDDYALRKIAEEFPQHTEKLITIVLESPVEFERLILNSLRSLNSLCRTAETFPQHASQLIKLALKRHEKFGEFIIGSGTIRFRTFRKIEKTFLKRDAELLIKKLFSDPKRFWHIVKEASDLVEMNKEFSQYAEILIKIVLEYPAMCSSRSLMELTASAV